jgi:tRNA A37 methylthiotransferase MiaB
MKSFKVCIESAAWMCEGNIIDSSRVCRYIQENGHYITDNVKEADFIIINSCGFIKSREEASAKLFEFYYSQKKDNASIIMFGCLIKINKELINSLDLIPIDFNGISKFDEIFYNKIKFEDIKPYCDKTTMQSLSLEKKTFEECDVSSMISLFLSGVISHFSKKVRSNYYGIIDRVTFRTKILVEICKGCIFNCNYCMIKKARGNICSRQINDIINDIEQINDPTNNMFLVADDCGSYGIDNNTNFFKLLFEINKKFPDLKIELDAINPYWLENFSNEYIDLFSNININFANIPIQSGSNKILKKMNRDYEIGKVIKVIKKIKQVSPETVVYTHFIVGYPGENTIDFLKNMLYSIYFDLPIVIKYSEHKDSVSSTLPHQISKSLTEIRYLFFMFFLNFAIFHKLLSSKKY